MVLPEGEIWEKLNEKGTYSERRATAITKKYAQSANVCIKFYTALYNWIRDRREQRGR
jgi:hypothetical protein